VSVSGPSGPNECERLIKTIECCLLTKSGGNKLPSPEAYAQHSALS
jgi:hypothetical protein